ncbi:MAG: porin family protein [Methylacidiphilales bacterium]|nr:porin family protein [Candidatus Methylacidiphilales bacterium]
MNSSNVVVLAGALALAPAAALAPGAAWAADMPALLEKAPIIEDFGGWYLRGDIGMTNQRLDRLHNVQMGLPHTAVFEFLDEGGFDSGWLFGLGVGYQFNSWLRADLTGEYRGTTGFRALDRYDTAGNGTWDGANEHNATKSEWLFLANAYVDLGTWWHITPFIGAGIGAAEVSIDNYNDVKVWGGGGGYAASHAQWNFAWALHAGLAYHVSPAFTVELAYRYLSLGDGKTGDVINYDGTNWWYNPTTFHDITSHDVKFAVRWALGGYDTPVVRKY